MLCSVVRYGSSGGRGGIGGASSDEGVYARLGAECKRTWWCLSCSSSFELCFTLIEDFPSFFAEPCFCFGRTNIVKASSDHILSFRECVCSKTRSSNNCQSCQHPRSKTSYQVKVQALLVCLFLVRTNGIGFRRPASAANRRGHSKGAIGPRKAVHHFPLQVRCRAMNFWKSSPRTIHSTNRCMQQRKAGNN